MASVKISDLTATATVADADLMEISSASGGAFVSKKSLLSTVATYIIGKVNAALDATPLSVTRGGTGGSTQGAGRTGLGLGTIATQDAGGVAITGGSVTGITDLAVIDGGTGASNASSARANLGLAIGTNVQGYDAATLAGQASQPTLTVLAASGTGATVSQTFSKGGGTISLTTGSDAVSGDLLRVTYATPFANRSHAILYAATFASANPIGRAGYAAATAANFVVSSGAPLVGGTMVFHYMLQGS